MIQRLTHSPGETEEEGFAFAKTLAPGSVVGLYGDLGSGKTCFVKGAVRALGVAGPVKSPTFSLVNPYPGPAPVFHVDAYRLRTLEEIETAGMEDLLTRDGFLFVEWADRIEPWLPPGTRRVAFKITGENQREIIYK